MRLVAEALSVCDGMDDAVKLGFAPHQKPVSDSLRNACARALTEVNQHLSSQPETPYMGGDFVMALRHANMFQAAIHVNAKRKEIENYGQLMFEGGFRHGAKFHELVDGWTKINAKLKGES